jgi:hypothetical protein
MAKLTRDELIERVADAIKLFEGYTCREVAKVAIETYEELTTADAYGTEARNRLLRGLHGGVGGK